MASRACCHWRPQVLQGAGKWCAGAQIALWQWQQSSGWHGEVDLTPPTSASSMSSSSPSWTAVSGSSGGVAGSGGSARGRYLGLKYMCVCIRSQLRLCGKAVGLKVRRSCSGKSEGLLWSVNG